MSIGVWTTNRRLTHRSVEPNHRLDQCRELDTANNGQRAFADSARHLRRTTRSVFAGSKRPVRASAQSTRQAPRVASSQ